MLETDTDQLPFRMLTRSMSFKPNICDLHCMEMEVQVTRPGAKGDTLDTEEGRLFQKIRELNRNGKLSDDQRRTLKTLIIAKDPRLPDPEGISDEEFVKKVKELLNAPPVATTSTNRCAT